MTKIANDDKIKISKLIESVEKQSSAEIVVAIAKKSAVLSFFLTKNMQKRIVKKRAMRLFYQHGLDKTKDKLGLMFFVSLLEKRVEIIADEGICKHVKNDFWQEIIDNFIVYVKNGELAKGYMDAIGKSADILIELFPIKNDDQNELSNEMIEV